MPLSFLHGVEVIEINDGARPIKTVKSSVIGIVGTAPDADPLVFPLNTPVLIAGTRTEAAALDITGMQLGTLPSALDDIFDQAGAMVVVIRVAEGATDADTITNVIGGVDAVTGQYTGVQALLSAQSVVHVTPRILIAPAFTSTLAVTTEMLAIADRLRAVIVADGPNTNDADAIAYRGNFGSRRVYIVDPWVTKWSTAANADIIAVASARVAGLIAKSDQEKGFWHSPSNQEIYGITGTARAVDFILGDANARANYLNANDVATIIHEKGYRLWGNRTCSSDPKWAFLSVVRTADMINESIMQAHLWAVDRNITKTYVDDVLEGINNYLRHLKAVGAILGGTAWVDPSLNSASQVTQGNITFDFDFTAPYPAEHITFRSHLVDGYIKEVFA